MLKIEKNIPLAKYTSLKIGSAAEFFAVVKDKEELLEAISWAKFNKKEIFVLGGGSNVLIAKKIKGLVLKNEIKGIEVTKDNKTFALLTAKSGELWTRFVHEAVKRELYGLENLYLIPGTVGAAPVQNIGAYGAEFKDCFHSLIAIDLKTGNEKKFSLEDCKFAYRESVFKRKFKNKYFIYEVTCKLSKKAKLNLDYGDIKAKLAEQGIIQPTLMQAVKAIESIRNSKLPNPVLMPNAGSFFKNPEIPLSRFKKLQKQYSDIKYYPLDKKVKVPAGWLIEQAGFKGKKYGSVSMYEKQALILVNHGNATPAQILAHVKRVQLSVFKKFAIKIEPEVNIIK